MSIVRRFHREERETPIMSETPNLKLPYIAAAQAQKHVTHNESIRAVDALLQLAVLDRNLLAPPGQPAEGDRYIVGASPAGAWSGHAQEIAAYQDGGWIFYVPREGFTAWIADEQVQAVWSGTQWAAVPGGSASVNPVALVGVNATADATNKLSVRSPATLLSNEGAGHQLKVNKFAAGDTASLMFQTAFSGRAEMGLTGDDNFHVKVSADGASWKEALVVNRTTGAVDFPNTAPAGGEVNTSSNAGTGVGLAKAKTGVNLPFKSLKAGANVTLTDGTDEVTIASTGGGVTAHSALTGLGNDDHPQYCNTARANIRYLGSAVRTFRGKCARLDNGETGVTASVVMLGDSWIGQNNIATPVRDALQTAFGNAGWGYVTFNATANVNGLLTSQFTLTLSASWAIDTGPPSDFPGPDVSSVTSATAGHTITLTGTNCTGFTIHYYKKSGVGTFSWSVDGGGATNIDTSNATTDYGTVATPDLAPGSHTLTLTVVSGSVTLCGAVLRRGTTGAIVHRCGLSGSNTGVWQRADGTLWGKALLALNPDLITITLGVNDAASTATPPSVTATNLGQLIDRIQAVLPYTDIVIMPQTDVAITGGYANSPGTIADYAAAELGVALTKGCGYVQSTESFGTWADSNARGLMLDNLHPNATGGRIIANLLLSYVTRRLRIKYASQPLDNTFFPEAAKTLTTGHSNVAFGANTTLGTLAPLGQLTSGTYNVAAGDGALGNLKTGRYSVAIGYEAGKLFDGDGGVFVGFQAAVQCTGAGNVGVGYGVMPALTTGAYNIAIGASALNALVSASNNVAIGASAGQSTTGANGTFIGRYAAYQTTAGGSTAVGSSAGGTNTSGANNTWLGTFADSTVNNLSKAIAIGYNAKVGASNACAIGGTGSDAVKLGVDGVTTPTKSLDVGGDGIRIRTAKTPASASDTGNAGEIVWDSSYVYVCVAANTWKRSALATW